MLRVLLGRLLLALGLIPPQSYSQGAYTSGAGELFET